MTQTSAPALQIAIDSHDDKAWRDTLLKVAAILCERQPDSPLGYRLRRHALWQSITSTPQAESDGRTPLAAVSADMVADYHAQLGSADMALWQQVEKAYCWHPTGWTVTAFLHRRRTVLAIPPWPMPSAMKSFPSLAVCPLLPIFCLTTTHRLFLKNEAMACNSAR